MLPGGRDLGNPEHRAYIAGVWGIDEADLPGKGTSMMEMVHQMSAGEIRGLLGICNNPFVSLPHHKVVRRGYEALEFHAQSDFFLSETAERADVVLPTTAWAEDEGVMTNGEGRVIKHNKAAEPPGEARPDWWIMCELARRLGVGDKFPFSSPREVFDELRVASKGGAADYFGITYEKVEETGGVFWPCPDLDHPGTPRPFEGGRFYHPDGKARFIAVEWRPPAESPDPEYPLRFTTGRTVAHFLSGNQTRRLPGLVEQTPRPWVEVHPSLGFGDGDPVRVVSRRGQATYPALVTETIRPDTVFVPYHLPVPVAANLMTIDALDPVSRMPEFKVCAVRVERGDAVDPVPAPPVPPGQTAYEPETRPLAERRSPTMPPTVCMHCEDPVAPCAEVCPADAILVTADGVVQEAAKERCIACGNCVSACPFGVPKIDVEEWLQYKCNLCYDRTSVGLAPMCATVCPTGAIFYGTVEELEADRPAARAVNVFDFGGSKVRTGCAVVVPRDHAGAVPGGF